LEDNTVIILDKDGWIEYSKIAKNYSIFLSSPQKEERFYRALVRHNKVDRGAVEEVYRRINTDREKFQGIYDMVDFVVPQFYNEDTINVLEYVLEKIEVKRND
jgi:cytidylate kinase